ncbi:MAG TPA: DUF3300 domain-containing protein, partial [Candidatus Methylomirabilis sp.]|nr:DUF3300 domain-containing protein [Candidatus Methylomirabilis sp.]
MGNTLLKRCVAVLLIGLLLGLPAGPPVQAQTPPPGGSPPLLSQQQLEELVGRVALYPDDLLAILLPASTFPLDVVQADRFLQRLKQDKNLQPDERWDESVRNLLNYPEVISMMSQDLDWTRNLGEAVVTQQADVMKAIQAFRAKAQSAGNLKTDDKQIVVQENNVIQIVPADPEVIYVPQYQPAQVVVYQPEPVPYYYYPTPYPSYYYPYPPGYAFATGFFFGAMTAWAFNWGGGHVEHNVNINNTRNFNTNRVNPLNQQKLNQARQQGQLRAQQQPAGRQQGQRGGAQGGGRSWQSGKRPGDVSQGRVSPRTGGGRPGYGGASQRGEFGDPGRGRGTTRDASRGTQSRGGGFSGGNRGAGVSTMDRGGGGRTPSPSTMDRGGTSRGGGGGSFGGGGARGGGGG